MAMTADTATDPKTIPPAVFQQRAGGNYKCLYYLLIKGGYISGSSGLFVGLFVDNLTQKVMNRLG